MLTFRILAFLSLSLGLFAACGSSGASPTPSPSTGDSSTSGDGVGACIDYNGSDGALSYCTSYMPGTGSVLALLQTSCTMTPPAGFTTVWKESCPPGAQNGCQYPPDAFGATGPTVVWYYQSAGACLSQGVMLTGDAAIGD
jgi:hypothetical protein